MKKVFSVLVLTSLFAVLLVPVAASAASIGPCQNCVRPPALPSTCECGTGINLSYEGGAYCYNGVVKSSLEICQAAAGGSSATPGAGYREIPNTVTSPETLLATIVKLGNWIFTGLLALAAIFMVIAGFFFVTGGGEPEKVNKARQMLINALIGVAVGLASKGLVMVIEGLLK